MFDSKKSLLSMLAKGLGVLLVASFTLFLLPNFYSSHNSLAAYAQDDMTATEEVYVKPRLVLDRDAIVPGAKQKIGVIFDLEPHWHIYYKDAGEAGMPTQIEWNLPEGFKTGPLLWEKPSKFVDSDITTYGYDNSTIIAAELEVPKNLKPGEEVKLAASLKWLSCKEICLPGEAKVNLSIPVKAESSKSKEAERFEAVGFTGSVKELSVGNKENGSGTNVSVLDLKYKSQEADLEKKNPLFFFGFALLGGFILNFMPCVLPVIAIKVMSFLEQADEEPGRVRTLGLVFTAGIVSAFLVLALIVLSVRAAGQTVGWGFQFQYPGFIIGMCVIVLVLSLSLFGLFYVEAPAGQDGLDKLASKEGVAGTFFKGVLATTLSTPCTAPFLGAALGFAFAQPDWIVLGIFLASGLGMSLPYLVLTAQPKWMKFLPKPGAWMEKFKESMGFVMLATVIWLLGVLASQVGSEGVMWTSFFLLTVALATWIVGSFIDLSSETPQKIKAWSAASVVALLGFYLFIFQQPSVMNSINGSAESSNVAHVDMDSFWTPFSVDALNKALAENKTVFLDFTADWCLTCKVNEKTVIGTDEVVNKMKELNVLPMKADWTKRDKDITKLLSSFGRSGVPLYVIYPAGKPEEAKALPDGLLTSKMVLEALEKAGASK